MFLRPLKLTLCFGLATSLSLSTHAYSGDVDGSAQGVPLNTVDQEMNNNQGAYASATFGSGRDDGTDSTNGNHSMQGRALELRFGKEFNPGQIFPDSVMEDGKVRVDVLYDNEGHPDNNHRDGFGMQVVLQKPVSPNIKAEVGVGPYVSMNTTVLNGIAYDDTRLGMMVTMAVLANMDRLSPGLSMRFAINHVVVPGAPSTNAYLVGLGKEFGHEDSARNSDATGDGNPVWIGVMGGDTKTNHGDTPSAKNAAVEIKRYSTTGPWAASVEAIHEGSDGVLVDRNGVAIKGWFIEPLTDKTAVSVGAGPYIADNELGPRHGEIDGIITVQVEHNIGKNLKIFANFSRIATFNARSNNPNQVGTDRDMGRVGISKRY